MKPLNYTLFFDFHTSSVIPDVGKNFDVEQFTDALSAANVDFITWHARCNQGNAYYDTKIGLKHPSLDYDLFGQLVESCHRKGIRISAYINGGLDDEELMHHRDWMRIAPDGRTMTARRPSAELRAACYNSPYREHLKSMVSEISEMYHVDGFFIDCMDVNYTCICPYCMEKMHAENIDWNDEEQLKKFTASSIIRLARELREIAVAYNPESLFYLNSSIVEPVLDCDTQLECECLPPCPALGYDYLPVQAHYLRTIAEGKRVLCMTGRFYEWGDFGGFRREESIEYDLLYGMANGMRPEIADHYHPRCDFYPELFQLIGNLYGTMQKYDEWCLDAVNHPEIAIVFPDDSQIRGDISLKAAVRMMTELKYQVDVVTMRASWKPYRLLIFPDHIDFSEEICRRVREHLDCGGKVLASAFSGLAASGDAFALQEAWPVQYEGKTCWKPLYFEPSGKCAEGLPHFPLSVYAGGAKTSLAKGATMEMAVVRPYFSQGEWDGLHSGWYAPPQHATEETFVARKDNICYCSGEIFQGYYQRAPYQSRQLLHNIVSSLYPRPKFRSQNLPSTARVFVQYRKNQELLHILAYTPELRGDATALEERGVLLDAVLALREDSKPFHRAFLAGSGQEIDFEIKDGYAVMTLPRVIGYELIVFEYCL